jgi:hypothetical protein
MQTRARSPLFFSHFWEWVRERERERILTWLEDAINPLCHCSREILSNEILIQGSVQGKKTKETERKKERKSSVERQFPSCWTLRDAADAYFWVMGQIALVTMAWKIQQHSFCTSSFSTAETSWLQADDSPFPRQMLLRCANNTFPTLLWRIMQASCEWILPPLHTGSKQNQEWVSNFVLMFALLWCA